MTSRFPQSGKTLVFYVHDIKGSPVWENTGVLSTISRIPQSGKTLVFMSTTSRIPQSWKHSCTIPLVIKFPCVARTSLNACGKPEIGYRLFEGSLQKGHATHADNMDKAATFPGCSYGWINKRLNSKWIWRNSLNIQSEANKTFFFCEKGMGRGEG